VLEEDELDDDENPTNFAQDSYWKYPNSESVHMDFNDSKPLCLVCDGVTFGAMVRNGTVVKFSLDDTANVVEIRGMHFHSWHPDFDKNNHLNRGFVLLDASEFNVLFSFVLLPLQLSSDKSIYAAVRDDYTMMDNSGNFS
jgi:hypothetical protein